MTTATIGTDLGDIVVELYDQSAPKAAANFVKLATSGFYDGVIFHRVIPGFVIQAGDGQYGKKASLDPGRVGTGGPGYKFEDEKVQGDYVRGALAMANAGPNTNTCEFFIMHGDVRLPPNYVIFGRVARGIEVVDAVANAPTTTGPFGPHTKPVVPTVVRKVTILP